MVRPLIAISTCWDFEKDGKNSAVRQTWLPEAKKYFDVRFFVGMGQGAEEQEATGDHLPWGLMVVNEHADTILLPDVDDGYGALTSKTQHSLRWAHARGYQNVFRCFADCYCVPERLIGCGFEAWDFMGDFRAEAATQGNYASGGAGYWLSRKAFSLLIDAPILGVWQDDITVWAEDLWVGQILKNYPELTYKDDWARFVNHGSRYFPTRGNGVITCHLSCPDPYVSTAPMYAAHNSYLNS